MQCRICGNRNLNKFLSLGNTPLANAFVSKQMLSAKEKTYPLEVCFCPTCKLIQLSYVVSPELMFKNYLYVSSTTKTFQVHFSQMAEEISAAFNFNDQSLAVDIGSNDGLLLKGFKKRGAQIIGVEPATNIAKIAEENGVETINDFFNEGVVEEIISRKGNANVVTATNVFAHVDDIAALTSNVKKLLKKNGIFVIEVPYLLEMLEQMTFDAIYHEHLSYFSLTSLVFFFRNHGMEIFDVKHVQSHGGSLRIFVKKSEGMYPVKEVVNKMLMNEEQLGVHKLEVYQEFARKVEKVKQRLVAKLIELKKEGKTVVAYGAPAKGNTLLNYCGVGTDYIDYVVDDNSLKIGLYTPGTHIPVVGSTYLDKKRPDYILILAWNFASEILKKTEKYANHGVKFIVPLPDPVVI